MTNPPVAVGGVGGSGTRVIVKILHAFGVFTGSDLPSSLDTVWYAALFGRRDVLLEDPEDLRALAGLFFQQMAAPSPLSPDQVARLHALTKTARHQHAPDVLEEWIDGFIRHCDSGMAAARWGWKLPYTHVLIDRFLAWNPDLKYIHVTRNGLDMAFSRNQNQLGKWGPIFLNRDVEIGPRDSLKFWCAVERRMDRIEKRFPGRIMRLRFERLVTDPGAEIDRMSGFLHADMPGDHRDALCNWIAPPKSIDRYMNEDLSGLDPQDIACATAMSAK